MEYDRVIQADCIKGLQQLEDGVVDLAFADPPFNIGYDYDTYDDNRSDDDYLAWCREWLGQIVRALKPTGTFWLAIGDEYAADLKVLMQRQLGLTCRSWVVWYYTFGVNCKYKFSRSHAHLFHMVKDADHFTFNVDQLRVPSARQLVYADARANPRGRLPDDTWILRPQDLPAGFRADEDTWYFPRVAGTFKERAGFHGCQMPEQLLGRVIRASSNEGELVLDPFAGSGTTLVVAKKLQRRYLGFELSAEYAQQVESRLANVTPGDELAGAPEPLVSAPSTTTERRKKQRKKTKRRNRAVADDQLVLPGMNNQLLNEVVPVNLAICNETFQDWPLAKGFRFARDCGYAGIEIAPFTINKDAYQITPEQRAEVKQLAADCGLTVIGLHWLLAFTEGYHLTSPDATVRQRTGDYMAELARLCADIGGSVLVLGSPQQRNLSDGVTHDEAMEYAAEVIRSILPTLQQLGVTLAVEPLGPEEGDFLLTAELGRQLVAMVDSPACRLHLDVKAMSSEGRPIDQIVRESAEQLVHFHANDANRRGPGMGDIDFVPILRALQDIEYAGWVSVEVFDYSPGVEKLAQDSIQYLRQCLDTI